MKISNKLPITVLLAVKNEALNLPKCLSSLNPVTEVILIDSNSTDGTVDIALKYGARVIQFDYQGGYPKKRQWALDNQPINTPWVLMLDADEVITDELWIEIKDAIYSKGKCDAFLINKGFHFLGRPIKYGGFSHEAVLLFKAGTARYEKLFEDSLDGLDMEIHERLIIKGSIGKIKTPLVHEDYKGLEAYIAKHNKYSTWEANVRKKYLESGKYGAHVITSRFLGNSQERRRALKQIIIRFPFEQILWFCYHYFFKLGFMEGRAGLIASQIRASYISQVKAKIYELSIRNSN